MSSGNYRYSRRSNYSRYPQDPSFPDPIADRRRPGTEYIWKKWGQWPPEMNPLLDIEDTLAAMTSALEYHVRAACRYAYMPNTKKVPCSDICTFVAEYLEEVRGIEIPEEMGSPRAALKTMLGWDRLHADQDFEGPPTGQYF